MSAEEFAEKWHRQLFRTDAIRRPEAEAAVRGFYREAGLDEPETFLWFDSPLAAIWSLAVLLGDAEPYTQPLLQDVRRRSGGKARLAEIEESLAGRIGRSGAVGGSLGRPLYTLEGKASVTMRLMQARMELILARAKAGRAWQVGDPGPFAAIDAAEKRLFGYGRPGLLTEAAGRAGAKDIAVLLLRSAQHRLYNDLAFGHVARDEAIAEAQGLDAPLPRAFWTACEGLGLWWPLERGVVLAERPVRVEGANEDLRMEWADGFAVGTRGSATPAPPPPRPAVAPAGASAASILAELPRRHDARLAFLREKSSALPHLDRYLAGELVQVWKDLAGLGPGALTPPHAADALAVAYETMHRVERNIRTLAERLERLGYRFVEPRSSGGLLRVLFAGGRAAAHRPHVPPAGDVADRVAELEEVCGGPVPLSLRAFFDTVGEVNFIGEHERLAPRGGGVLPDPLFVHGVEDAIGSVESWDEDEAIFAFAPDAYHKADVSGGDPYMIRLPAAAADVAVEAEPAGGTFVEYLRHAIGWGGFPGWAQAPAQARPPELESLREGLVAF